MSTLTKEQRFSRLRATDSREPEYHECFYDALGDVVSFRERKIKELDDHGEDCTHALPDVPICLGPGRCKTTDSEAGCSWCMRYPMSEGEDYIPTFIKIHEQGH